MIFLDKELIGKRIRRQREIMSLTRDQFAERIEISPQFLAEIENGKKGMSAETLYKICDFANTSADYILLGRTSHNNLKTPTSKALENIPAKYTEVLEDVLNALVKTIKINEDH